MRISDWSSDVCSSDLQIIACDNHEYLAVIKVTGRAPDAYAQDELKDWIEALHNVLRGLPMGSLGLYSHIVRRRVTEYPDSAFNHPFASRFDAAYQIGRAHV